MYNELTTPAVIVDLDIVEANLAKLASKLSLQGIKHRPHMKTHKSVALARMQLAAGAHGITVAKLSEAEVFAAAGIDNILLAFPLIGKEKLQRFARLHQSIEIMTVVDSLQGAVGLSEVAKETGKPVQVLIEVDGGLHRGGRQPGEDLVSFACQIRELEGIRIAGILSYFGQIYREKGKESLRSVVKTESELIRRVTGDLQEVGISLSIISSGSTPSSLLCEDLHGATEVRAGNYIFNDVTAMKLGLVEERDCALRVIATVVSLPIPGRATIDAGSKTLTSDRAQHHEGYGIVAGHPFVEIIALNEEHGMLQFDPASVAFSIGDRIEIIPNHACVIPNLNDSLNAVRKGKVVDTISIDARGCNY
ncbi:alanine racemase [Brevibacillus sp. NRS-1366]|uniref:alanine racemase n=1 Tax=Brevibacillus sp. NRS-1366 TaxID=3233899 RepID=UPI003D2483A4